MQIKADDTIFTAGVLADRCPCFTYSNYNIVCLCCGSKFLLVKKFSNQFDFYFPLSQIMVVNTTQMKTKLKLVKVISKSLI